MNKTLTREQRITLMQAIYQYDLCDQHSDYVTLTEPSLASMFDEFKHMMSQIDEIIENHLFNYRLNRVSYVDRAIIRLAVFEVLTKKTAGPVAINEAIELTKIYTNLDDEKQHKFNNKLLDSIYQSLKE